MCYHRHQGRRRANSLREPHSPDPPHDAMSSTMASQHLIECSVSLPIEPNNFVTVCIQPGFCFRVLRSNSCSRLARARRRSFNRNTTVNDHRSRSEEPESEIQPGILRPRSWYVLLCSRAHQLKVTPHLRHSPPSPNCCRPTPLPKPEGKRSGKKKREQTI